jgi:hypothetical protein
MRTRQGLAEGQRARRARDPCRSRSASWSPRLSGPGAPLASFLFLVIIPYGHAS